MHLRQDIKSGVEGRAKLGVEAFAEALLGVPKILAENSGYDAQVQFILEILLLMNKVETQRTPRRCTSWLKILKIGQSHLA